MLPQKIYEVLPYAYVCIGVSVIVSIDSWLAVVSGVVIATVGAVVWILRSDNRRSDIKGAREKYGGVMPFWLYEMLPFSYFMLAMLLFVMTSNVYAYPFAVILMGVGIQVWGLRGSYRKHQRPVPVKLGPLRSRA
jgi:protein-S-isoprenylcysteine O-methyltransferase Ste14